MAMAFKTRVTDRLFVVDDCDAEWVAQYKWYSTSQWHPHPFTVERHKGKKKKHRLARVITQAKPDEFVRYRNGNRLDCRRENLWLSRSKGSDPDVLPRKDPMGDTWMQW